MGLQGTHRYRERIGEDAAEQKHFQVNILRKRESFRPSSHSIFFVILAESHQCQPLFGWLRLVALHAGEQHRIAIIPIIQGAVDPADGGG